MFKSLRVILSVATLATTSALLPINMAWGAGLHYSNSLESGYGDVHFHGGCYPYAFNIVSSPVRDGTKSVRVLNKGMEDNSTCTDWVKGSKHRAEIRWGSDADATYSEFRSPHWFGVSIFVPTDFPTRAQNAESLIALQLIGAVFGPELWFQIRGGDTWEIRRDWSTDSSDKGNEMTQATIPVERGVWTDWVIYRERSWDNDGVLKVWMNGKQVVNFVGPTAVNYEAHGGRNNVIFKTGIYWGTQPRAVDYTLYFDNVRTAKVADGYALVAPSGDMMTLQPPMTPSGLTLDVVTQ